MIFLSYLPAGYNSTSSDSAVSTGSPWVWLACGGEEEGGEARVELVNNKMTTPKKVTRVVIRSRLPIDFLMEDNRKLLTLRWIGLEYTL